MIPLIRTVDYCVGLDWSIFTVTSEGGSIDNILGRVREENIVEHIVSSNQQEQLSFLNGAVQLTEIIIFI